MLNWFVWNRTVYMLKMNLNRTKLHTYADWFVWIRTVWLNWIALKRKKILQLNCTYAKLNCLK